MNYGMVPPPSCLSSSGSSSSHKSKSEDMDKEQKYIALTSGYTTSKSQSLIKKRTICDDDYFDETSDDEHDQKATHSSQERRRRWDDDGSHRNSSNRNKRENDCRNEGERSSSSRDKGSSNNRNEKKPEQEDDEEDDPLDAFMAGIEAQAKKDKSETEKKLEKAMETGKIEEGGGQGRGDIDEEDMQESYFKFLEEYNAKHADDDEDVYEYDEDGNIIWTWKKVIDPLPAIDHVTIPYKPFQKDLYTEHEDIATMNPVQVFELRNSLDIRVYGPNPPRPVVSFAHFCFDDTLMKQIRRSEFEKPTPIQAQAVPTALNGRDVLGLARTGSGKTMAYVWPAIVHIMEQNELGPGEGPIALVVVPTRELAIQVYQHAKQYCRPYNINVVCAYGGGSKYEQKLALEEGAEFVVCTPGRIIDMVKLGATNFYRTTFLVFDEVDRMFDLGFEPQVKSIADHIRPDRQCLMFSATMRKKVEKLVVHALVDPVKIVCGDVGEANADVQQIVHVLPNVTEKWNWLSGHIVEFCSVGKLLIFVTKKIDAEDVAKKLRTLRNIDLVLLHGDMLQNERNEQIAKFRAKCPVMVATDVAARGLDIPEIKTVVNYDVARDIDTHVHRIGRTGRAGQQGFAHTLVTEADKEFCGHLVKNLESIGQFVSPELLQLAQKSARFKAQGGSSASGPSRQRMGLGYKPKTRNDFGQGGTSTASSHLSYLAETAQQSSKPTISKIVERAKSIADSSSGFGSGLSRADMMRTAMRSSFQHTFHKASTDEWSASQLAASDPRPEWQRQLEERAAAINRTICVSTVNSQSPSSDTSGTEPVSFGQKKKRSRWNQ